MNRDPLSPRRASAVVDASSNVWQAPRHGRARTLDASIFSTFVRGSGGSEEEGDENAAPPPALSAAPTRGRGIRSRLKLGKKDKLQGEQKKTESGRGKREDEKATSHSLTTITAAVDAQPSSIHMTYTDPMIATSTERKEMTTSVVDTHFNSSNDTKPSTANSSDPPEQLTTAGSKEALRVFPFSRPVKKTPHSPQRGEKKWIDVAHINTNNDDIKLTSSTSAISIGAKSVATEHDASVKKDDVIIMEKKDERDGTLTVAEDSNWSQVARAFTSCGISALFSPKAKETVTSDYDLIKIEREAADARAHAARMEQALKEKSHALTKEQDQNMELREMLERTAAKLSQLDLALQDQNTNVEVIQTQIEIKPLQSQEECFATLLEEASITEQEFEHQGHGYLSIVKSIKESPTQSLSNIKAQEHYIDTKDDKLSAMITVHGESTVRSEQSTSFPTTVIMQSSSINEGLELHLGESVPSLELELIENKIPSTTPDVQINADAKSASFTEEEDALKMYYHNRSPILAGGDNKMKRWVEHLKSKLSKSSSSASSDAKQTIKSQQEAIVDLSPIITGELVEMATASVLSQSAPDADGSTSFLSKSGSSASTDAKQTKKSQQEAIVDLSSIITGELIEMATASIFSQSAPDADGSTSSEESSEKYDSSTDSESCTFPASITFGPASPSSLQWIQKLLSGTDSESSMSFSTAMTKNTLEDSRTSAFYTSQSISESSEETENSEEETDFTISSDTCSTGEDLSFSIARSKSASEGSEVDTFEISRNLVGSHG